MNLRRWPEVISQNDAHVYPPEGVDLDGDRTGAADLDVLADVPGEVLHGGVEAQHRAALERHRRFSEIAMRWRAWAGARRLARSSS